MGWDEAAATWDDDPAVRAYSEAAFRSLLDVCAARGVSLQGARVLDVGCGTGLLSVAMAGSAQEVVALDVSPQMIAVLSRKLAAGGLDNVRPTIGDLDDPIAEDGAEAGPFDLITCSSVCAFLDDYPATAARLVRGLQPGGLFVQWDWASDPDADETFGLTPAAIRAALQAAGLQEVVVDVAFFEPFEGSVMAPLIGVGRRP